SRAGIRDSGTFHTHTSALTPRHAVHARRRNLLGHLSIAPVEPRVQGSATEGSRLFRHGDGRCARRRRSQSGCG
ncbi:unnamed protein product, partial [Pylaiella littoralis]